MKYFLLEAASPVEEVSNFAADIESEIGNTFSFFDLEKLSTWFAGFLPKLIAALIIIVVGFIFANLVGKLLMKWMVRRKIDVSIHNFARSLVVTLLKMCVLISALSTLGLDLNTFIAALGGAGVAAGIGLKDSLSQFVSGIEILVNRPFKVDDFIEIAGNSGRVADIRLMYTTLITIDNKRIIVPNSHFTTNSIINYTAEKCRRIDLDYSISYETDIAAAKAVLEAVVADNELILKTPLPVVAVKAHDSSAVILVAQVWCNSTDYWKAYFSMQEQVKIAFDANGITIPFNQLDVHMVK